MRRLSILYWNVGGNDLRESISSIVKLHNIDIVILSENKISGKDYKSSLPKSFLVLENNTSKNFIISKFSKKDFSVRYAQKRYVVCNFHPNEKESLILMAVHLPSKLHQNESNQMYSAQSANKKLLEVEHSLQSDKSIVLGDFNMNPYENGLMSINGFNAVMTKDIAKRVNKTYENKKIPYFYNPMWSKFGDGNKGVSGTYYYSKPPYWNMFDQVLIKPSLLNFFKDDELEILTSDNEGKSNNLLTRKKLINRNFSDHLPLKVVFEF